MQFFSTLKQGQRYMETWVLEPKLALMFPENRIIKATKFAIKLMPFFAVFAIVWQQLMAKGNFSALAIAVMTALFSLCIPLQGLYWLGKRAMAPLEGKRAEGFFRVFQQLEQAKIPLVTKEKPTYQDLAELFKKAQQHLDRQFWEEL